jgi:hypothetical protein
MSEPTWIIMPVVAGREMTEAAIADCLAQSVPVRVLVVNQAVDNDFRDRLERITEEYPDRVFLWSHEPTLPSLAATWNCALKFVWAAGGTEALVVNNDVRLHPWTVQQLSRARYYAEGLFVSAVGVTPEQFAAAPIPLSDGLDAEYFTEKGPDLKKGGPDFSCFLISQECHRRFRFDENFIPAFCEDLDYHRTLMLAGEGKRIFSINLPYLHLASQTLKQIDPYRRQHIEQQINGISRAYYERKWGGPVNQETFWNPFDDKRAGINGVMKDAIEAPTTPTLQKYVQEHP